MATRPEDDEDDTLELTAADEMKPNDDGPDGEEGDEGEDETPSVTFGDEDPDPDPEVNDSSVIRRMRQELREAKKKLAEAEKSKAPPTIEVGEKPTLESCGYDEDAFAEKLSGWHERKQAAERQQETQAEENRRINEAWQQDLAAFEQKKGRLEFDDRDEAIDTATSSFNVVQQAVIVKAADDPALLLYALAKSEAKRDELAKIHDPIKMAAAVARIEGAIKVTKGRKAPAPDKPATGSASVSAAASDKQLEKLEKDAARTGDRTKLIEYKKTLKTKAK